MNRVYLGLTLVLVTLSVCAVEAPARTLKVSRIYSDLSYNVEGGDLLGMEVLIVPAEGDARWNAFVQIAEGGAPYCVLVPLTVDGNKIKFTLPPRGSNKGLSFAGTISAGEMNLRVPDGPDEHLRRGKSYWQ